MRQHIARLWETDANGRNLHPVLPNWSVCCGKWTHDGKYYVFGAWNGLESGMPFPSPNLWAMRMGSSLFHQTSPELFQLTTGPIHFFNQILSTDEKAIFTTSTRKQGELLRYEKKTGRLLPYLRGLSAESVSFSRDGKWIAYVKFPQGELWRSRTDGSEELQLTSPPLLTHAPNWSPDGKQIAFSGQRAGEEWQLYLISADGGVPQPIAQTDTALESTWSPNGRSLLFQIFENGKGRLRKVDLNQRQVSDFPGSEGLLAPRWTQNGRYVAAAKETNGRLMLFDFKIGVWAQWAQVEVDHVPVWSRDGTTLYFVSLLNKIRGIYRVQPNQRTPQLLTDLSDFQFAGSMGTGMSLLPDDEPLLLHDVGGGTEVYALYWDSP
jgi:WD40 repeat protein